VNHASQSYILRVFSGQGYPASLLLHKISDWARRIQKIIDLKEIETVIGAAKM
jgi:hypothetical protein